MAAPAARRLASVPRGATAEEVAAIVAALAVIDTEDRARAAAAAGTAGGDNDRIDAWVRSARLSGRGQGFTRGSWRLGGRLNRRHRA
ncbi:MAG TPA: acyl-CoA carboxylase subunit epsilon [Acidimicrobiia bacterium]|nr:acyl-CoA carboxylase subunit epsilon [Acidimicrobiia bacterium]